MMPGALPHPLEQEIEQQARAWTCPQCGAPAGRSCRPFEFERNHRNNGEWQPVSHTGRLRLAMAGPSWTGPRPVLDIQPECLVCATDPIGHLRAKMEQGSV